MAKNEELEQTPKNQELVTVPSDLIRDAGRGTEDIGVEDVRPPRILICQSGSPQRKPDDAKQIPGLNELDIFNDLSGEIYGRGPLKFVVIKAFRPRYIEFAPMDQGGGIVDFDVKSSDPRTQFSTDANGKRVKPRATKFHDFLVWLPDHQEIAVLTMKSTQIPVAVQLNGKMKLPLKGELIHPALKGQVIAEPPAWARTFSVSTVMARRDSYAWGNYNLKLEGLTPQSTRELCAQLNDVYAKKNIIIEREPDETESEGDASFDPSTMEPATHDM